MPANGGGGKVSEGADREGGAGAVYESTHFVLRVEGGDAFDADSYLHHIPGGDKKRCGEFVDVAIPSGGAVFACEGNDAWEFHHRTRLPARRSSRVASGLRAR